MLNAKLAKFTPLEKKCDYEKNPGKCKAKLQAHINKTLRDIQILKDDITGYKNEAETARKEIEFKKQLKAERKAARMASRRPVPPAATAQPTTPTNVTPTAGV